MSDPLPFASLGSNRVIPVVTFEDANAALMVGEALLEGGVSIIEVTLRTAAGLPAIRLLSERLPHMLVGAGTVTSREKAEDAARAGASFLVSPGHTADLIEAATDVGLPWMPGASSLSEIMFLRERGFLVQKFFPAEQLGGRPALKAIASVMPDVKFCPTGGITSETAPSYLTLPNVAAVGGSWLVPPGKEGRERITSAARAAAILGAPAR